jgi:hypothetical protein
MCHLALSSMQVCPLVGLVPVVMRKRGYLISVLSLRSLETQSPPAKAQTNQRISTTPIASHYQTMTEHFENISIKHIHKDSLSSSHIKDDSHQP